MRQPSSSVRHSLWLAAWAAALLPGGQAPAADVSPRQDLEIVECLLPGSVRLMGSRTYLTPRRPTRTTTADCRSHGGEYVLYDRADYKSALRFWLADAQAGDAEAQTNAGEILERGAGGTPDPAQAAAWYQKAADQGYSRALFNLGTLYEQGLGVPQDRIKALNLYRRAWGVPEDSLVSRAQADEAQQALRESVTRELAEKDQQLEALRRQLTQLQSRPAPAPARVPDPAAAARQIATLQGLIARLEGERAAGAQRLAAAAPAPSRETPMPPWDHEAQVRWVKGAKLGRYYALVIGNQTYQKVEPLKTPRTDAQRITQLLQTRYGFIVQTLEDASDVAMLRALNELNKVLKPGDNLLIYYTGHGERMKGAGGMEAGYWLPVNAERPPDDTFWVANDQVTAHLGRLPALRVLVLADSCYSGLLWSDPDVNIFGTEGRVTMDYMKYKLPRRARLLIASGGDRPVPEGQGEHGDSVFARALLDVLGANNDILSAPGLLLQVRQRLQPAGGGVPVPDLKAIKAAGHELGDFFFVPRG